MIMKKLNSKRKHHSPDAEPFGDESLIEMHGFLENQHQPRKKSMIPQTKRGQKQQQYFEPSQRMQDDCASETTIEEETQQQQQQQQQPVALQKSQYRQQQQQQIQKKPVVGVKPGISMNSLKDQEIKLNNKLYTQVLEGQLGPNFNKKAISLTEFKKNDKNNTQQELISQDQIITHNLNPLENGQFQTQLNEWRSGEEEAQMLNNALNPSKFTMYKAAINNRNQQQQQQQQSFDSLFCFFSLDIKFVFKRGLGCFVAMANGQKIPQLQLSLKTSRALLEFTISKMNSTQIQGGKSEFHQQQQQTNGIDAKIEEQTTENQN